MSDKKLLIIDSETHEQVDEAHVEGSDVIFPDGINGWTDVVDCRHEPYTEQSIDELCEFAHHVRKHYVLITPEQAEPEPSPETDAA